MLYRGMLSAVARFHHLVARALPPRRSSLHRSVPAYDIFDRTRRAIWPLTTPATAATTAQLPATAAPTCDIRQDGYTQPLCAPQEPDD